MPNTCSIEELDAELRRLAANLRTVIDALLPLVRERGEQPHNLGSKFSAEYLVRAFAEVTRIAEGLEPRGKAEAPAEQERRSFRPSGTPIERTRRRGR